MQWIMGYLLGVPIAIICLGTLAWDRRVRRMKATLLIGVGFGAILSIYSIYKIADVELIPKLAATMDRQNYVVFAGAILLIFALIGLLFFLSEGIKPEDRRIFPRELDY